MKLFAIRDFFKTEYQEYIIGSSEIGKTPSTRCSAR